MTKTIQTVIYANVLVQALELQCPQLKMVKIVLELVFTKQFLCWKILGNCPARSTGKEIFPVESMNKESSCPAVSLTILRQPNPVSSLWDWKMNLDIVALLTWMQLDNILNISAMQLYFKSFCLGTGPIFHLYWFTEKLLFRSSVNM